MTLQAGRSARLAAAILAIAAPAYAQAPNTWTLNSIYVMNKFNQFVQIVHDEHNAGGGRIDVNVDGRTMNSFCAPGSESMTFTWRFRNNIGRLRDGDIVTADLTANQAGQPQGQCVGYIAALSDITLMGSSGSTWALPDSQIPSVNVDRFSGKNNPQGAWVRANDGPHARSANVGPNVGPADPAKPWAYFYLSIGVRGSGTLTLAYVYKLGEGGALSNGVGGGPSTPPAPPPPPQPSPPVTSGGFTTQAGVDHPGGDYKNFALPQADPNLCRQACASDSNCAGFVYTAPGTQGPQAHCWLKSSIGAATNAPWATSGVKVGSTAPPPAPPGVPVHTPPPTTGQPPPPQPTPPRPNPTLTMEPNINFFGGDYANFELGQPNPELCRQACAADGRCRAYSYIAPNNNQGPKAHCWLKSSVPQRVSNRCCVSGVKQ